MKNLLRLTLLAFFFSTGLLSCTKNNQPSKDKPAQDNSLNNDKPGGGKYIEIELASAQPDWTKIKVGETITLKFKVTAPFDGSKGEYNEMVVEQAIEAGSTPGNVMANVTVAPISSSSPQSTNRTEKDLVSETISSKISETSTNKPIYMQVTIKPNHAVPTIINIITIIADKNHEPIHKGKTLTYKFTPTK